MGTLTPISRECFDMMIGQLDRLLSELILTAKELERLDEADRNTLKHHAEDMIGAGHKMMEYLDPDPDPHGYALTDSLPGEDDPDDDSAEPEDPDPDPETEPTDFQLREWAEQIPHANRKQGRGTAYTSLIRWSDHYGVDEGDTWKELAEAIIKERQLSGPLLQAKARVLDRAITMHRPWNKAHDKRRLAILRQAHFVGLVGDEATRLYDSYQSRLEATWEDLVAKIMEARNRPQAAMCPPPPKAPEPHCDECDGDLKCPDCGHRVKAPYDSGDSCPMCNGILEYVGPSPSKPPLDAAVQCTLCGDVLDTDAELAGVILVRGKAVCLSCQMEITGKAKGVTTC